MDAGKDGGKIIGKGVPFERIRRITGYLVGTLDRFNNAKRGPTTFFYIDPPYWDCENYYGKGIFSREDFGKLATLLAGLKGRFILSLNDTPGVRDTFKTFRFEDTTVSYTCSKGKNLKVGEVFIRNF